MKALTTVCNDCPFRKDSPKGWLGEKRIKEIIDETVLGDSYFTCHKTLDKPMAEQRMCAGKLVLEGRVNAYGNRSTRFGMMANMVPRQYSTYQGADLVFNTVEECIEHHKD